MVTDTVVDPPATEPKSSSCMVPTDQHSARRRETMRNRAVSPAPQDALGGTAPRGKMAVCSCTKRATLSMRLRFASSTTVVPGNTVNTHKKSANGM